MSLNLYRRTELVGILGLSLIYALCAKLVLTYFPRPATSR